MTENTAYENATRVLLNADSHIDFDPAALVMRDAETFKRLAANVAYFLSAPLIDCKYLTAVCKAAAALRPARSRASFRIEGAGAMEAVISLDDDAAAVVMGIHAPDSGRYEETITGILDAE